MSASGAAATVPIVALVGNPNAGKTTLFNGLTGSHAKTGNYAGVTVEVRRGEMFTPHGHKLEVWDLPGCYSLRAPSPDEQVAVDVLHGRGPSGRRPDLLVCVLDASNLERHLLLALQLLELQIPLVVVLNMVDVAEQHGLRLDVTALSEELGVPVVPLQANRGKGVVELKQALRLPFPHAPQATAQTEAERRNRVLRICQVAARRPEMHQLTLTDRIDEWLLHPWFGWLTLLSTMFLVFWAIFSFAEIPMGWIEAGQGLLADGISRSMPEGDLRSLLVDGVIGGVGGVLVFLPQIVLLFFFIGLLESSGYMARAAYLMDGLMGKAGLSGKAFLPLFSAYACAIPGVMATRTIDSAKERLVTMLVAPWMSCSARLPVYFLLVPLLLHEQEGSRTQAAVLFGIYLVGTLSAFIVARVLRGRLGPDSEGRHFLLELPPYRLPQWGYIFRHVAERAWSFIAKAGTIILGLSILLWALSTYPKPKDAEVEDPLSHSAIGRVGAVIEPLVEPLGFDGRTGTAILTSFAAREVFNASMAVLFRVDQADDETESRNQLRERLSAAKRPDGSPMFSPLAVVSLLVFYIYALQCLPTSVVVARESGSWKWAVGQFGLMTLTAYGASLLVYQVGSLLGF